MLRHRECNEHGGREAVVKVILMVMRTLPTKQATNPNLALRLLYSLDGCGSTLFLCVSKLAFRSLFSPVLPTGLVGWLVVASVVAVASSVQLRERVVMEL